MLSCACKIFSANRAICSTKVQFDGTMVAAEDVAVDLGVVEALTQTVGDDEVVDAPAHVLLTGLETVRPPRILHLLRVLVTEAVRKAAGQQVAELLTLLIRKAGIHVVRLWILEVDLLVGHVQVTAEDDGLLLVEALEILAEGILPRHAVLQSLQAVLGVRRVTADEEEVCHLEGDDTPLMVVQVDPDAIGYAQGMMLREDSSTGIAFLLGIVPITLVTLEMQIELSCLHLRLLKTEEIGIQLTEHLTEALTLTGAQTVHIPTDKLHR